MYKDEEKAHRIAVCDAMGFCIVIKCLYIALVGAPTRFFNSNSASLFVFEFVLNYAAVGVSPRTWVSKTFVEGSSPSAPAVGALPEREGRYSYAGRLGLSGSASSVDGRRRRKGVDTDKVQ